MQESFTMYRFNRFALATILLASASAFACQVPVFRYALEQWPSDNYKIVILHDGPLSPADQSRVSKLDTGLSETPNVINADLRTVDVSKVEDESLSRLWTQHGTSDTPIVAVYYPDQAEKIPDRLVQATPLRDEANHRLADSPVRKEVARRLLSGASAVWLFVPCGDPKLDDEAYRTLQQQLEINEQRLELPPPDELASDQVSIEATHIELRIEFSIVQVDRSDDREKILLNSLLRSESELETLNQPMAFPVLGRGRVLYALVGKGISADTIAMASSFVVGPCSCQVKNLNPGFDLLLNVDWEKGLEGSKLTKEFPKSSKPTLLKIAPGR